MTIQIQRILLPTDFSNYSAAAAKYACELAVRFNSELHVLHTLENHLTSYSTGPNISAMEERGIEFLSPLSELKCENNPALREDPTVPVAAEDVKRLPVNPQSKRFCRAGWRA